MTQVSVAEAKAKFSSLLERALNGEEVEITRRGKPIARLIRSAPTERPPFDLEALKKLHAGYSSAPVDSETWWREYREGDRY